MFSKNEIRRGDKICFRDTKFLKIIEVTDKYITVEKDQFTKKSVKRDDFRIVKINGRYHACELFDRVVKWGMRWNINLKDITGLINKAV